MTDPTMHIAMCADFGFALPMSVSLASLDAALSGRDVRVHIVHPGFSESLRARITAPLSTLKVSWLTVDEGDLGGAFYSPFLSDAANYRLLLDQLLPADVTRVLYLDGDTIIVDSLVELYQTDLQGNVIAAVRDSNVPWAASMMGSPWREIGLDPSSPYFNSGMMLIDLARWREESIGKRALELLQTFKPHWGDQDSLNAILEHQWLELPMRWNVQTADFTGYCPGWALWRDKVEQAIADPALIHYTGLDKPWHHGTQHPKATEWLGWLDRTSWAGWRPSEPKVGRLESLVRGAMTWVRTQRARRRSQASMPKDLSGEKAR